MGVCDGEPTGTLEAIGYALRDGKPVVTPWFDATNKIPSGGFVCNSTDLALFAAGVMNHTLISEDTLNAMAKPQRLASGKPTHYGLGWLTSNWGTEKVIFHNGGQPGYSSLLYIVPGKKFAVAILTNMSNAKLTNLALGIRQEVVH